MMKTNKTFRNAGFAYLGFAAWYMLVSVLAAVPMIFIDNNSVWQVYLMLGIMELCLSVPYIVYYALIKAPLSHIFGAKPTALPLIASTLLGVALAPALIFLTLLSQTAIVALGGQPLGASVPSASNIWEALLGYVCIGVTAAVAEEPMFRGIQLHALSSVFGKWKAILLSALFFAVAHGNISGFMTLFAAGVVLAMVRYKSGSLWCVMTLHAAYNGTSVLMDYLFAKLSAKLPQSITGAQAVTAVDYLRSAYIWFLIAIPCLALCVLLYIAIRKTSPKIGIWAEKPWQRGDIKGWHYLAWVGAFCISFFVLLLTIPMIFGWLRVGGGFIG